MAQYRVAWNKSSNYKYELYKSNFPGGSYSLESTIYPSGKEIEEWEITKDISVNSFSGYGLNSKAILKWEVPELESSNVYKVVPFIDNTTPKYEITSDYVWMNNTLPYGAVWIDQGGASWEDEHAFFGSVSLRVSANNNSYSYPQFANATYSISDRYIITWVYIDSKNRPDSIMISLYDGSWNHRAYWGKNLFPFGEEGTPSMIYMGGMPSCDTWVPLILDKELVQANNVTGFGYGVFKEESTDGNFGIAYFDFICSTNQKPYRLEEPLVSISYYNIYRQRFDEKTYSRIGSSNLNSFTDNKAVDTFGYNSIEYSPNYSIIPLEDGASIKIKWVPMLESGTQYFYKVNPVDSFGQEYSSPENSVVVASEHGYVKIRGGTSPNYDSLPLVSVEYDNEFVHTGLDPNTTYYYRLESYDNNDKLTSIVDKSVQTKAGSIFDYFILDSSPLG